MSKKLSIITIVLNDCDGLKKTMESIFSQTFTEYEYIIIDGASTDGTVELIKSNESRIDKWISGKDSGIYDAFNKGIRMAGGEYCLFLNAGDYLQDKNVLYAMMSQTDGSSIVYGNMIIMDKDGRTRLGKMPEKITFQHMIADTLWHPVSFIPRILFEKFGLYDESFRMISDYDFFLRCIFVHGVNTKHVDLPVVVFNLNGFSSDPKNMAMQKQERRRSQEKYFSVKEIESAEAIIRKEKSIFKKLSSMFKFS